MKVSKESNEDIISYTQQLNKLMRDIVEGNANYVESMEVLLNFTLDAAQYGYIETSNA